MLIHIIDGNTVNPVSDLAEINEELFLFNPDLKEKAQIVAVNKIDIPAVRKRLLEIEEKLAGIEAPVYFISAATGEGVTELISKTAEVIAEEAPKKAVATEAEFKVFRPKPIK